MINHYIPNQRDIKAAHDAGLNDRQIINLCKCDTRGAFLNKLIENPPTDEWFAANRQQLINNGVML